MRAMAMGAALLVLPALAAAQVPARLGYQGLLLRSDGSPESGVVQLGFKVYAVPSGGSALWSEDQSVALSGGYYATFLGEAAPLPGDLFDGSDRYLEVSVSGTPLLPRQKVGAVAYAMTAGTAKGVTGGAVDATSLKVGGKPVVDSSGKFVAGVEWGNLEKVPEGFADGQDDVGVTQVTAQAPLSGEGSATSPLLIGKAGAGSDGYLSAADWAKFDGKAAGDHGHAFTASAPLAGQGTASAPLVIGKAGAGADGYLSAADWAAFSAKASGDHGHAFTASAPLTGQGTASAPLVIGKASASADGYLASGDFAKFEAKVASVTAGTGIAVTGTATQPVVSLGTNLTLGGKTTFGGSVAGLRFETASSSPVTCNAQNLGYVYYDTTQRSLRFCDGTNFIALASATPAGCAEIKQNDTSAGSGIYKIDPDGAGSGQPFDVWCEMDSNGVAWTRVFVLDAPGSGCSMNAAAKGSPSSPTGCDKYSDELINKLATEKIFFTQIASQPPVYTKYTGTLSAASALTVGNVVNKESYSAVKSAAASFTPAYGGWLLFHQHNWYQGDTLLGSQASSCRFSLEYLQGSSQKYACCDASCGSKVTSGRMLAYVR